MKKERKRRRRRRRAFEHTGVRNDNINVNTTDFHCWTIRLLCRASLKHTNILHGSFSQQCVLLVFGAIRSILATKNKKKTKRKNGRRRRNKCKCGRDAYRTRKNIQIHTTRNEYRLPFRYDRPIGRHPTTTNDNLAKYSRASFFAWCHK